MNNILVDAIHYYDNESYKFYNLLVKFCNYIKFPIDKELDINTLIELLNKKPNKYIGFNEELFESNEILPQLYFQNNGTICIRTKFFFLAVSNKVYWYWYWTYHFSNNYIYMSKKILRYGLDINIDDSADNYNSNLIARTLLINGKIDISHNNHILLLKALSLFITNSNAIIELKPSDSNLIHILVLYDIEDLM